MRHMQLGPVLLSVWAGLNLAVALVVTAMTLAGRAPPALALVLSDAEIARLDPRVVGVVNAQALIANPVIAALCVLVIAIAWRGIAKGLRWALWATAAALVPLQVFGFVSDAALGHHNLVANVVSSTLLLAALLFAARAAREGATPAQHVP